MPGPHELSVSQRNMFLSGARANIVQNYMRCDYSEHIVKFINNLEALLPNAKIAAFTEVWDDEISRYLFQVDLINLSRDEESVGVLLTNSIQRDMANIARFRRIPSGHGF